MTGLPYFLRLILPDLGLRGPKNPVRGSDVAGVVEAVGKDVTRFKPDDEVYGIGIGSYAEYTRVSADKLRRPLAISQKDTLEEKSPSV